MIKKVSINIKMTQTAEEEKESTDLFTCGTLDVQDDEQYVIAYDESDATGYAGSKVTLTVRPGVVTLLRSGTAMSNLIIEKGRKHYCHYGTPYGSFMVGIFADKVESEMTESGGKVEFKYTIDINSSYLSDNEMIITVKENEN